MESILYIVAGFVLGWWARGVLAELRVRQFAKNMSAGLEEALEEVKKNVIKIKIEKVEEGFFVYALEDHGYMAQGKTRKELEENLSKRYPGKTFAAEEANLKEVGFLHESV